MSATLQTEPVQTAASLLPYWLGLGSNLCFAIASIVFTQFSRSHSPTWVNQLKVSLAFVGFFLAFMLVETWTPQNPAGMAFLLGSGFVGLFVGDYFLFKAFADIGPARTLVLFSFQPVLMGIYGYVLLGQEINRYQAVAILCMIVCLVLFVIEKGKLTGKWHWLGFAGAFMGVLLDSVGIVLTRQAYEMDPGLGSFQANGFRALGAMVGFLILKPSSYLRLWRDLRDMVPKTRWTAIAGSFIGTFVSLSLYLRAIKTAHVATLTAITITLPIWAGLFEHLKERKWPTLYLWLGFIWFGIGFLSMMRGMGVWGTP